MHSFESIGSLDAERQVQLEDWPNLPPEVAGAKLGVPIPNDAASLASGHSTSPDPESAELLDALVRLGILPEATNPLTIPAPTGPRRPPTCSRPCLRTSYTTNLASVTSSC